MTDFTIVLRSLRVRAFSTLVTIASVAVAVKRMHNSTTKPNIHKHLILIP